MTTALRIAQIGATDEGGGAATVMRSLMQAYRRRGHRVNHFVGRKLGADPDVVALVDDDAVQARVSGYTAVQRALGRLAGRYPARGFGLASRSLRLATHPRAVQAWMRGEEDFDFPSSARLLDALPAPPDIVHAHNLHGGFFDLRALAPLSRRVPTVVTLHDMWLLTGHCAQALGCDRWRAGCGRCPDLSAYPSIRRDATDVNWRRKRQVYANSRLHVAVPSQWLRAAVADSMLMPGAVSVRVIANGVDPEVFAPRDRAAARDELALPRDRFIVMTTAADGSRWKDDACITRMIDSQRWPSVKVDPLFVSIGGSGAIDHTRGDRVRRVPYQRTPAMMARYYQAADVYVHAARADSFPLAVLEALACGTPVVATSVGGIPEQIRSIDCGGVAAGAVRDHTGMLIEAGDADAMAAAVIALAQNEPARTRLAANAAADARARFSIDRQANAYLDWYAEILS